MNSVVLNMRCPQHCRSRWKRCRNRESAIRKCVRLDEGGASGASTRGGLRIRAQLAGQSGGHRAR
jgi:hypothetical protein